MPRKSATAVAEKPASQRKTRTPKATPAPEPAKFQVGDRVFYVQETNTGIVQDLREGEALIKLSLAASKPLWLGLGQLHPYTVNHVVDVTTLVKGELIKGQTLQGDEHSGKFTNLSASGMAMIEVDGKKRMLSPYTLVKIEGVEPPHGDDASTPPPSRKARKSKASADAPPPSEDGAPSPEAELPIEPKPGDKLDGLSLTGGYHTGVFVERTTSGLFLIRKEDGKDVIITPDSARILDQQALPIELPITELPLTQLRTDGGTQPRAALDQDHVKELTAALSNGEKLPPVAAFYDGTSYWLGDGFHRLEAHSRVSRETIPVEVKSGTQRDAILYAVGTNAAHGLKRSAADKRRAVLRLLEDPEWSQWGNREIARLTKTSHPFVEKTRSEMPTNVVDAKRKFQRNGQTHEMSVPAKQRPKDPIPTLDELEAMFSQLGTVKRAKKGESFAVENEAIGAPFPMMFKSRLAAWDWWKGHPEQIAKITKPLEPHPQTGIAPDVPEGLAKMGMQICRPSISPEEFNREMEKPLPLPNNAGDVPKGVCSMTDIPGGYRLDGLEMSSEVYLKLVGIARRYTKDMSLRGAIEFLVNGFEMQEGA